MNPNFISRQQMDTIISNAPAGTDKYRLMDNLVANGYQIEGVDFSPKQNYFQRVGQGYQEAGQRAMEGIQSGAEQIQGGNSLGAVRGGLRTVGSVAQGAFAPLEPAFGAAISGVKKLSETAPIKKIGEFNYNISPEMVQKFQQNLPNMLQKTSELASKYPELSKDLEDIVNLATLGVGGASERIVKDATGKAITATKEGVESAIKPITEKAQKMFAGMKPTDYESAVKSIDDAYKSAFVENKVGVNNKLTKLGNVTGKSPDELINDLARAGITPEVEGKLAKFDTSLKEISTKQTDIGKAIDTALQKYDSEPNSWVSLDSLKSEARQQLVSSPYTSGAELNSALSKLDKVFESYSTKYGQTLTPRQINSMRIDMNRASKAFNKEVFDEDVASVIGDIARKNLDNVAPDKLVRKANAQYGELETLKKTIGIFNNQVIDVGALGTTAGKFGGALVAGGLAAPFSAGGSLVIAGAIAGYGGDLMAKFLRNKKFSASARKLIVEELQKNPDITQQLIESATKDSNKKLFERLLAAPKKGTPRSRKSSGAVIPLSDESLSTFETRQMKEIQAQLKQNTPYKDTIPPETSFSNPSVGKTDLLQEAKKYKSAEEFVKAQGTPIYRGEGGSNVAQGKALLAEGKHFASDSKYPQGFGQVSENIIKPNAKVLDLGDSTFAEISQKLGIPERKYISPKELSTIAKEKGYDVLKYNGEYKSTGKQFTHFVDLTGDSTIPKSQLEQIWKEANNK